MGARDDFDDEPAGADDDRPWDQDFADELVGQTILVGLTYLDADGEVLYRRQYFGTVQSVARSQGIILRLEHNGELFTIAPLLGAIEPAEPGIYQLYDSELVVEDPDYTALMTVHLPRRQ